MKECSSAAKLCADVFCHSPYLFRVTCLRLDKTSQYIYEQKLTAFTNVTKRPKTIHESVGKYG